MTRVKEKHYKMAENCLKSYNMILIYIGGLEKDLEQIQENDGVLGISYEKEKIGETCKINKLVENVATKNVTAEDLLKKKISAYKYKLNKINKALACLTKDERDILTLFYIQNRSWFEITMELYKSESTCKRNRRNAINKLAFNLYGIDSLEFIEKIV